ncbi:Gfo/Idh/MocA family protein [Desulfotruncus alcoholivorax]|uniref:Gfo/Idh/MocA family protein n=1 Tax=Desulfotruncus alcoholivorax TaxID=265477 RepID=UPI00040B44ED|nr:Gfo/Idh/MocA family oxidoreductase [Desulfotruncus alcoholivorax]
MNILVIGLGSMGKRRIRNLQYINAAYSIYGYDIKAERRREAKALFSVHACDDWSQVLPRMDAVIISTPPDQHIKYAMPCARNNIPFFIEASVISKGMNDLIKLVKNNNTLAAPSCTMLFHPAVEKIYEIVVSGQLGNLCSFTYHSGQYLPDWHPWEDIGDFYVSKRETSGCREIVPFELTWLTHIFGSIADIKGYKGHLSHINADIDDVYQCLVRFNSGLLGHLLVDVVTRDAVRSFRLVGDMVTLEWNWNEDCLKLYLASEKKWKIIPYYALEAAKGYNLKITEEMYIKELRAFLDALENKSPFPNTLDRDYQVLKWLEQMEAGC